MILHAFERDAVDVDQLVVVAIDELAFLIEHIGKAAGHARAEIHAGAAEHDDHAAGHVFAAMVADTFDHGERAGVAHAKTLAGAARCIHLAASGTVQTGVADDDRIVRRITSALRRTHDDAAAGHALSDAV